MTIQLAGAVEQFQTACRSELGLSEKTARAYSYDLAQFVDFAHVASLSEVDVVRVREYVEDLESRQVLKPTTVRRKVMTLKAFFGYFRERGLIVGNPIDELAFKQQIPKTQPRILNSGDLVRLLQCVDGEVERYAEMLRPGCGRRIRLFHDNAIRDRAIIELLFATAMRIGELTELDVEDVDLEMGVVHVKGKGNRDRHLVVSGEKTLAALREYWKIRRLANGVCPAFFLNRFHGRLSIFAVENMFERIRKAAGIRRRVTPHALRHTMATMLLNNGMAMERIRDILGHSSLVTTQVYDEVAPRRQKKVLDLLNGEKRLDVGVLGENEPESTSFPDIAPRG
ncbi:MAG: tyrosine-type recombinase/integrase [Deltaproteobacteria bacterium]|nr:tyrosine-type recombinase/integrase [Deltaproteobacteria bacterium]